MMTKRNLITDVDGLRVGNAEDPNLASGVTAILFDDIAVVSCAVMGGAPGTRETDLLEPDKMVPGIHSVVLGGGSAFGLDAASGVQAFLRENGKGIAIGDVRVPLVSQAVVFDLLNGGDKNWGLYPPYRELGYEAAGKASRDFDLGTAGGGYGATTVNLKGGLGSASAATATGHTVGALVIVNSIASAVVGDGPHFWAAPFEEHGEFGDAGMPERVTREKRPLVWKGGPQPATTIALVATDATLDKARAKRLALASHSGLAKSLRFSHGLYDGDTIFSAATGKRPLGEDDATEFTEICALAGDVLARAVARGVYEATALPFAGALPAWKDRFGG